MQKLQPNEKEAIRRIAYKDVFNTPNGKIVLDDLMEKTLILSECESDLQEGMRRIGLYVLGMCNWKHKDINQTLKEKTNNG